MERSSFSVPEDSIIGKLSFFRKIKFSWVGKNCLLGIDDQGRCCICWAFVSTEAITAAYALLKGEIIPLSKQHLLDCMLKHYGKPEWLKNLKPHACFAHDYNQAFRFAMDYGIFRESIYPYMEKRGKCTCLDPSKVIKKRGRCKRASDLGPSDSASKYIKISGFNIVSEMSEGKTVREEKKMIEDLIEQQPLTCIIPHVLSFCKHHGKRVYMGPTKEETRQREKLIQEGKDLAWHAILIVGYGREKGVDFYLAKNTYGKKWGYRGFAKIKRSIILRLSYPIIESGDTTHIQSSTL